MKINQITQRLNSAQKSIKYAQKARKKYREKLLASFGKYVMKHYPIYHKKIDSRTTGWRLDAKGNIKWYRTRYYTFNQFSQHYKIIPAKKTRKKKAKK